MIEILLVVAVVGAAFLLIRKIKGDDRPATGKQVGSGFNPPYNRPEDDNTNIAENPGNVRPE